MIPSKQRTIKKEIVIQGIGTHKGGKSLIRLLPAKPNTGVYFTSSRGIIAADLFALGDNNSNTSLKRNGFYVETVEHLLSCLYGLFIDNVEVEVHGVELPIGDGSAKLFYEALLEAGIKEQNESRNFLQITKPLHIAEDGKCISITPSDKYKINYYLDWHERVTSSYHYVHEGSNYFDVAYARTFADKKYIKKLRHKGLALGSREGVNYIDIETGTTRVENEFVKHKVLDLIGDLSLFYGMYILGEVTAVNAGHKLHHDLLKGIGNV